ncbi:hypothetical protein BJ741DRAFT_620737 [Chytriomyces cf. hyalinus JEL632]|nr:hypothetical protein BJ741DRAFT_620737 [Chytriomyces cf. hyalinus JEL632]
MTLFPTKMVPTVFDCWLVILFLDMMLSSKASEYWDSARISAVTYLAVCWEDMDRVWARGNMFGLTVVELVDAGIFW